MKKTESNVNKVTFGARKKGKSKKSNGPKDKNRKKYIGQGI